MTEDNNQIPSDFLPVSGETPASTSQPPVRKKSSLYEVEGEATEFPRTRKRLIAATTIGFFVCCIFGCAVIAFYRSDTNTVLNPTLVDNKVAASTSPPLNAGNLIVDTARVDVPIAVYNNDTFGTVKVDRVERRSNYIYIELVSVNAEGQGQADLQTLHLIFDPTDVVRSNIKEIQIICERKTIASTPSEVRTSLPVEVRVPLINGQPVAVCNLSPSEHGNAVVTPVK